MRSAPFLLAIAWLLLGPVEGRAAEARPDRLGPIEIHWVVQANGTPESDPATRQLRMSIPRDYVQNVFRDPRGTGEKSSGVRNNGIATVSVEALLPNLSPRLPVYESKQSSAEERRDFLNRQIIIDLRATARPGHATRDVYLSQARRGMFYRMPDAHGLERYRRMGCADRSAFDPEKFDVPRSEPPKGCRNVATDEHLLGRDGDLAITVTCAAPDGRCSMHMLFQGFWSVQVSFPHSRLDAWRAVRKQVADLLASFVVG